MDLSFQGLKSLREWASKTFDEHPTAWLAVSHGRVLGGGAASSSDLKRLDDLVRYTTKI
jgi:hypothetical protein